jgi:hypothetical protein
MPAEAGYPNPRDPGARTPPPPRCTDDLRVLDTAAARTARHTARNRTESVLAVLAEPVSAAAAR